MSPDGDEGYPGTLQARVAYTLTDRNELFVDYEATADRTTPVNLTQREVYRSGPSTPACTMIDLVHRSD